MAATYGWREMFAEVYGASDIYISYDNYYIRFLNARDGKYWIVSINKLNSIACGMGLGDNLMISGVLYAYSGLLFNGDRWWTNGSNKFLWRAGSGSDSIKWVITKSLGGGYTEIWDEDNSIYIGDEWYTCDTYTGTFVARGSLRGNVQGEFNGTPLTVALDPIVGWMSSTPYGVYQPQNGASGTRTFGWKEMEPTVGYLGYYFIETPRKYADKSTYKPTDPGGTQYYVWWSSTLSKWIVSATIGVASSAIGYYMADALPVEGGAAVSFTPVRDDGSMYPASLSLGFKEYVKGSNTVEDLLVFANTFYGGQTE